MKAKVVGIESASQFTDKRRRVMLRFEDADLVFNQLRVAEDKLGFLASLALDDTLDVEIVNVTMRDVAHGKQR